MRYLCANRWIVVPLVFTFWEFRLVPEQKFVSLHFSHEVGHCFSTSPTCSCSANAQNQPGITGTVCTHVCAYRKLTNSGCGILSSACIGENLDQQNRSAIRYMLCIVYNKLYRVVNRGFWHWMNLDRWGRLLLSLRQKCNVSRAFDIHIYTMYMHVYARQNSTCI